MPWSIEKPRAYASSWRDCETYISKFYYVLQRDGYQSQSWERSTRELDDIMVECGSVKDHGLNVLLNNTSCEGSSNYASKGVESRLELHDVR